MLRRSCSSVLFFVSLLVVLQTSRVRADDASPASHEATSVDAAVDETDEAVVEGSDSDIERSTFVSSDVWGDEGDGSSDDGGDEAPARYVLDEVRVEGNGRTRASVVRAYVPLAPGDHIDPDDERLELITWALRGTGFFERVQLRLERGERRGHVILVVEVRERNAFVVQQFTMGISEGLSRSNDMSVDVRPYVGVSLADTNLFGTGSALSLGWLLSERQQGVRIGFQEPRVAGSPFALRLAVYLNNARQYFGSQPIVSQVCPPPPDGPEDCSSEVEARNAVVFYRRGGIQVGAGRTVGTNLHYSVDFIVEGVNVRSMPEFAGELRGLVPTPIDFAIQPDRSYVSSLRLALLYDKRDDPALTTRGVFTRTQIELGTRLLGSSYNFVRIQGQARGWIPLAPRHTLRLSAFVGVVVGDAPFFYRFHVSDLTDLVPSRILEMEIDRRPSPNLFGTSIRLMRNEEFAARLDVQYDYSLFRSAAKPVSGVNLFVNVGLYTLADLNDLAVAIPGYTGAARIPIDMTFDVGFRIDTAVGTFDIAFANFLGFLAW